MKVYFLLIPLALLALVGIGLSLWGMREGPTADGQAAVAYLKSEDGEWERQHGERTANRTTVPKGLPDGAEEEWLTKFVLTERSGERVGSQELLGTPYVAGFFFSTCPTICVQQNSKVKELQQRFRGEAIRFLSISCDPEVDRPEVLQEYAQRFDADPKQWWFLTGEMNYIRRVGGEVFRLGVVRRNHPEKFALMDAEGDLYGLYTWSEENQWDALIKDIEKMLAAGGTLPEANTDEVMESNPAAEDGRP